MFVPIIIACAVAYALLLIIGDYTTKSVYGPELKDEDVLHFLHKYLPKYYVHGDENRILSADTEHFTADGKVAWKDIVGLPFISTTSDFPWRHGKHYISGYGTIKRGGEADRLIAARYAELIAALPEKHKPPLSEL